jgi:NitT/TauT family transport system substrate-binding protein
MGVDIRFLRDYSATYSFTVSLDQALLASLEDQARWTIRDEKEGTLPTFLDHFHFDAVSQVAPENVTIKP